MDELVAVNTKAFLGGVATQGGPGGAELPPTVLPDGTKQFELTTCRQHHGQEAPTAPGVRR